MKRLLGAVLLATLSYVQPAMAAYPDKPVRVVVPYQAGQGTDVAARFLAERLTTSLGQAFIVENHPGAEGNIGASYAARATPDGYTILMGTNATNLLNQYLYGSLTYNPEKDFDPVILVSSFPMVLLAPAQSPYRNLDDLLKAVRAKPDKVDVSMPSTTARLVLELLKKQTATRISGIPYKGSGTAMTDLVGGQVSVGIDTISAARGLIESGKLKPLAVTSLKPSKLLPGVPAVAEEGVPGFQVIAWNAVYVPRGTPPAVVDTLNKELSKILKQPDVQKRLLELGHETAGGTPGDLAGFAQGERKKWAPLIDEAGLKVD